MEVKKSDNKATRLGKPKNGLDSNLVMTVPAGTYDYFVDVFGASKFTGQVATGNTATINLTSTTMVTLSGNVKDSNAANVSGVLITAKDSGTGLVTTTTTDTSGNYTMNVKAGTYAVNASRAEYVPGSSGASVSLAESAANYDFGGTAPDQPALTKAGNVIRGTVYASNGTTAMTDGFVTGTSSTGLVVTVPVDPQNGAYSLPVVNGTWTVAAKGSRHAATTKTGTVTVADADVSTSTNITLTADATKASTAESKAIAANVGGSVDSTTSTGVKLTAGSGVLESGSGSVTVQVEKSFTAPDTANFNSLGDASFNISATGSTNNTIKDLKGNAEIVLDYTSLVSSLPAGVTEGDLKLVYFSPERGEYVQVEGGFAIDQTSNTITDQTTHFTTFAIVYAPPVAAVATPAAAASSGGVPPSSLPQTSTAKTIAQAETPKVTIEKPISQMTKAEVQAKIAEIQTLIQTLLAQVAQLKGEVSATYTNVPKGFAFGTVLKYGATSDAVKYLQGVLKAEVPTAYGTATPISGWFGPKTKAALAAFQEKYANEVLKPFGLLKGTGYFGAKTMQKLNALIAQ
ncbi:MAG: peptidoglycan-binding protein [Candidatus Wildermuthbacteria bacterium]|nr:peptidoglycan-binding protein [Candidatus Wildermuthbacteria bacterium]